MKYHVRVGTAEGSGVAVEVEPGRVSVDGVAAAARLTAISGTPLYHLQLGDTAWTIAVEPLGGNRWILGVEGERVAVEPVSGRDGGPDYRPKLPPEPTGVVRAPMPGLVVRVLVSEGQRVEAGASVVVVEAMKMENELRAAHAGVVTKVHVGAGARVEKGATLVTMAAHTE